MAADLFETATEIAAGSVVDAYLRTVRGLASPYGDRWPADLRMLRSAHHPWSRNGYPAMVAAARDRLGVLHGVIVTFLARDGAGKADVQHQRMFRGVMRGNAVHLGPESDALVVAEGVETALAAAMLFPGRTAWAAGSAAGMGNVTLPEGLTELVIVADHDAHRVGLHAAQKLRSRVSDPACHVHIVMPHEVGADANDIVARGCPGAYDGGEGEP